MEGHIIRESSNMIKINLQLVVELGISRFDSQKGIPVWDS